MFGHTLHALAVVAIVVGFVWLVARDSGRMRDEEQGASTQDPVESGALEDESSDVSDDSASHPDPVESGGLEDDPERQ